MMVAFERIIVNVLSVTKCPTVVFVLMGPNSLDFHKGIVFSTDLTFEC